MRGSFNFTENVDRRSVAVLHCRVSSPFFSKLKACVSFFACIHFIASSSERVGKISSERILVLIFRLVSLETCSLKRCS